LPFGAAQFTRDQVWDLQMTPPNAQPLSDAVRHREATVFPASRKYSVAFSLAA
jgi:hypothetical protein